MPGGEINVLVSEDFSVIITGSVTRVSEGMIYEEVFGSS
jgi:diaminopimelate epimerase